MVAWVVNYRPHLRQPSLSRASLSSTFQPARLQTFQLPVLRIFFQVRYPATPLFATLAKTAGVCTNNSHSGTNAHATILATVFPLSTAELMSYLFISLCTPLRFFALSCASPNLTSFIFKPFRTLRQKTKRSRQPLLPRLLLTAASSHELRIADTAPPSP